MQCCVPVPLHTIVEFPYTLDACAMSSSGQNPKQVYEGCSMLHLTHQSESCKEVETPFSTGHFWEGSASHTPLHTAICV